MSDVIKSNKDYVMLKLVIEKGIERIKSETPFVFGADGKTPVAGLDSNDVLDVATRFLEELKKIRLP